MKNYFDTVQNRLDKYKNKYTQHPRKAAIKMALFNLGCSLKKHKKTATAGLTRTQLSYPEKFLRIAIAEGGGIGDALFQLTYIKEIRKLFNKPVIIDFYCRAYQAFQNFPFIDNCFPYDDNQSSKKAYDVYIISRRFYIIDKFDKSKTKKYSPEFYAFCVDCQKLTHQILEKEYHDNLFTQYALLFGKNRLEQANIHNLLTVNRHTPTYLQWDENEMPVLQKYQLENIPYITVCRAVDSKYDNKHPKLWSIEHYNTLIQLLKQRFPDIKIVQIGSNSAFGLLKNVDLNLVGKTTLEQTKIILKYSPLHIDGEGGLVHMKHFLNGKSVVLFGPTSPDIFGYNENINLHSRVCPVPCEWVTNKWTEKCLRGFSLPPCMKELRPETVFKEVERFLLNVPQWQIVPLNDINLNDIFDKPNTKFAQILRSDNDFLNMAHTKQHQISVFDTDLSLPNKSFKNNCFYLQHARQNKISAEYGNLYNIPAKDNSFDIVYCDRIYEAKYPSYAFKELTRILKENGTLILAFKTTEQAFYEFGLNIYPKQKFIFLTKRKVNHATN